MGLYYSSLCFRRPEGLNWGWVRQSLERLLQSAGLPVKAFHLEGDREFYGLSSASEYFVTLAEDCLAREVSRITGDYAICAIGADSDYLYLYLYKNGQRLDWCSIGEPYEPEADGTLVGPANLEVWLPLLQDPGQAQALEECLHSQDFVFVEDMARDLTELIGMPVIDDDQIIGAYEGQDFFEDEEDFED